MIVVIVYCAFVIGVVVRVGIGESSWPLHGESVRGRELSRMWHCGNGKKCLFIAVYCWCEYL